MGASGCSQMLLCMYQSTLHERVDNGLGKGIVLLSTITNEVVVTCLFGPRNCFASILKC